MKIIITGGTKGLGRAIAERFASEGFDLAVCSRTEADLDAMRTDFARRFPDVQLLTKATDVRKKEEVLAFADYIRQEWDDFDILVNNAGLFIPGNVSDEPDGALENMVETNLYSAYYLTRALLPVLLKKKKGHIFNMCSVASLKAYPGGGSYSIAKYALLGFSHNLRHELMDKGIRVTSIMPGATWSASWQGVDLPEERLMQADDIAIAAWSAWSMSPSAVVEDIVIRPQLGDL
jgi:NADP-dependent 3-hydroxy acid dehydrogenase YdfG